MEMYFEILPNSFKGTVTKKKRYCYELLWDTKEDANALLKDNPQS